jgi:tRNA dimethylallyltransferase
MLASGLLDEAARVGREAVAADAVGYPQALAFLDGFSTRAELRATLERATRRFSKRQRTWLRSEPGTRWTAPGDVATVARTALGW